MHWTQRYLIAVKVTGAFSAADVNDLAFRHRDFASDVSLEISTAAIRISVYVLYAEDCAPFVVVKCKKSITSRKCTKRTPP